MQLPILATLVFLAFRSARAQTLAGIPQCAQEAALAGIQTTGCKTSDIACICKATAFLTELKSTLGSICSEADQKTTVDFAISLCSSFGQSISAPTSSSSQAAEVFTSEIYVPTETSTPVETAILLYNEAPSPTAPVEEDVGKYATSDLPFPDSASFTVSTYLTSPTPPTDATTSSTSNNNNTRNNSTVTAAKKPVPFQGSASSNFPRGDWIAPCAALVGAAGLAFWL